MAHIAAILRSLSPEAGIATVIHNYVDDFNRDRLYLNRDTSSPASQFEQSILKQARRAQLLKGPPTKAIMPRSSYDRILAALPEISADVCDSQDIIDNHYNLHSYSTRPHLPYCLFYRCLIVLPVDVLFDVLHILWVFTDGTASQVQSLALLHCAYIPVHVILQFTRSMKRTPPPSLSIASEEPALAPAITHTVSTFGPNSKCSYLPRSPLSKELQTRSSESLQKQLVTSTGACPHPPSVVLPPRPAVTEQKTTAKGVDIGLDSDDYTSVPQTSFVKPVGPHKVPRALSLSLPPAKYEGESKFPYTYYLKRKHSLPPTSPRKRRRLSVGSGKENVVEAQSGDDGQGGTAGAVSSVKKRTDIQDKLLKKDVEREAKNDSEESEGSFLERRQRLEGLLFGNH